MLSVLMKFCAAGVDVAALELVPVGIGERMDEEIERAPFLGQRREDGIELGIVLDVAGQHELRGDRLGQRAARACPAHRPDR